LKKNLNYAATNVRNYGQLAKTGNWDLPRKPGAISFTSVPLIISIADGFTELQDVSYITQSEPLIGVTSFFRNARYDYTFSVKYQIVVDCISDNVNDQWEIHLMETEDIGGIVKNSVVVDGNDTILGSFGSSPGWLTFEGTIDFSILAGHDMKLAIRVADTNSLKSILKNGYISITQTIAQSPEKLTEGLSNLV